MSISEPKHAQKAHSGVERLPDGSLGAKFVLKCIPGSQNTQKCPPGLGTTLICLFGFQKHDKSIFLEPKRPNDKP